MIFEQTFGCAYRRKFGSRFATGLVTLIVALVVSISSVADDGSVRRIGFVTANPSEEHAPFAAAFRNGLTEGGYIEGKNVVVERRFGPPGATQSLIRELLAMNVEALITDSTPVAQAAREVTRTIPIVTLSGDPVAAGLVKSLSRPGGNVTGVSTLGSGLASKRLTLLKELVPEMRRLGLLWIPRNTAHQ